MNDICKYLLYLKKIGYIVKSTSLLFLQGLSIDKSTKSKLNYVILSDNIS